MTTPAGKLEVQGQTIGSMNEYHLAQALDKLHINFIYQYDILGGRSRRGGYVLDFVLLETSPGPKAINIQGAYWHKKGADETFERITIRRWCQERGWEYIEVSEAETESIEAATKTAKGLA